MIKRVRPTNSCPASLKRADPGVVGSLSAGAKELARVEAWFRAKNQNPPPAQLPKRPAFAAYGGRDVKDELEKMFDRKCAYCESPYASQQPVDVEHWRPKARINGEAQEGGYEWLAMIWENLLPSCIDCNRERTHVVPDPDRPGETKEVFLGKADHFPIAANSQRWRYGSPNTEVPLLIDPTTDDPAAFFDFPSSGVLVPKSTLNPHDMKRATESIRIYALNRKNLVDERRRHILRLEFTLSLIRLLFRLSGDPTLPVEHRGPINAAVAGALDQLRDSAHPSVPYSQFTGARIRDFIQNELGIT